MATRKDQIEELASGFMPARILLTALELDVFTAIGSEGEEPAAIARRTRTRREPLERLLNALVALKLLRKRRGRFHNTATSRTHLVAGAPQYLGDIMRHRVHMWESWSRLTETVRTGKPPARSVTRERERDFIKGMANLGVYSAVETVRALAPELKGARRLLDVGGGPAVYACAFARAHRNLRVTVLDLPGPLRYARQTIAAARLGKRVGVRPADAVTVASYGRDYDVVFMSNFIHSFKRPVVEKVIARAARALRPGGHLAIKDFFISSDGTAPAFAALFSINMLVADAGDCYSQTEVKQWMRAAGVWPARFADVAAQSGILVGVKRE